MELNILLIHSVFRLMLVTVAGVSIAVPTNRGSSQEQRSLHINVRIIYYVYLFNFFFVREPKLDLKLTIQQQCHMIWVVVSKSVEK